MLELKIKIKQKDDNTKVEIIAPKDTSKGTEQEKTSLAVIYNTVVDALNKLQK